MRFIHLKIAVSRSDIRIPHDQNRFCFSFTGCTIFLPSGDKGNPQNPGTKSAEPGCAGCAAWFGANTPEYCGMLFPISGGRIPCRDQRCPLITPAQSSFAVPPHRRPTGSRLRPGCPQQTPALSRRRPQSACAAQPHPRRSPFRRRPHRPHGR